MAWEGGHISAFEELSQLGYLGQRGVKVVRQIVEQEVRKVRPVQEALELDDAVQEFFVDRIEPLTAALVTKATSEESYGRLVRASVKNWVIDKARAIGTGPLRRSVEKVLAQSSEFERVPAGNVGAGRWRAAGSDWLPWGGDAGVLVSAAWSVPDVRVPKWSSTSRRPPVADRASLVAIIGAVLQAAAGSLDTAQVVYVFSQRFAAALDPTSVSFSSGSDEDDRGIDPRSDALGPEDELIAEAAIEDIAAAAAAIFGRLSDLERAVVPCLDDQPAVQRLLGLGRSQSALFSQRLRTKIRELAGTGLDREDIAREVIALCGGPAT